MQAFVRIILALVLGIAATVGLIILQFYVAGGDISGTNVGSVWEMIKEVVTQPIYYGQILGLSAFFGFLFVASSTRNK